MWDGDSMSETVRLVTAEEFEKLPGDDHRSELVEGRVIRMSPVGYLHGRIVVNLATLLNQHVKARRLGVVLTEVGFNSPRSPTPWARPTSRSLGSNGSHRIHEDSGTVRRTSPAKYSRRTIGRQTFA